MADENTGAEHPKVSAVRDAAHLLADAIAEAKAAGFAVTFPSRADGLASIAISETGRVGAAEETSLAGTKVETVTETY
jgi:hypothetical protein